MKVWIFAPKIMKIDSWQNKSFWNNFLGVKIQNFWNTKKYIDFSAKIQSMLKSEKEIKEGIR